MAHCGKQHGSPRTVGCRLKLYPKPEQAERFARWCANAAVLRDVLQRHDLAHVRATGKRMARRELMTVVYGYDRKYPADWPALTRNQIVRDHATAVRAFFANPRTAPPRLRHGRPVSVYVHNQVLKVAENRRYVRLSRAAHGWTRYRGRIPSGRILSGRMRRDGHGWMLSLSIEAPPLPASDAPRSKCGVWLSPVSTVLYDGQGVIKHPAAAEYRRQEAKLARLQRIGSRRSWRCTVCGELWPDRDRTAAFSARRRKTPCGHPVSDYVKTARMIRADAAVRQLHRRIRERRKNRIHNLTASIVRTYARINLQDLAVEEMARTKRAKEIRDAGMSEVRRQIEYKAEWNGRQVKVAHRSYPASIRCSACGWTVHAGPELADTSPVFRCAGCGLVMDRDVNAARNLYYDEKWTVPPRGRKPAPNGANGRGDP